MSSSILVYDGACPLCRAYCNAVRIDAHGGELLLVDAREAGDLIDALAAAGMDIDDGFILKSGDTYRHGAEVLHALALLSNRSGLFNRITHFLFKSLARCQFVYPAFQGYRTLLLALLGIPAIKETTRKA